MWRRSLESAVKEALDKRQREYSSDDATKPDQEPKSNILLQALQHSATRKDKIVRRRIGLTSKPESDSS